jgi:hypothetical protein
MYHLHLISKKDCIFVSFLASPHFSEWRDFLLLFLARFDGVCEAYGVASYPGSFIIGYNFFNIDHIYGLSLLTAQVFRHIVDLHFLFARVLGGVTIFTVIRQNHTRLEIDTTHELLSSTYLEKSQYTELVISHLAQYSD